MKRSLGLLVSGLLTACGAPSTKESDAQAINVGGWANATLQTKIQEVSEQVTVSSDGTELIVLGEPRPSRSVLGGPWFVDIYRVESGQVIQNIDINLRDYSYPLEFALSSDKQHLIGIYRSNEEKGLEIASWEISSGKSVTASVPDAQPVWLSSAAEKFIGFKDGQLLVYSIAADDATVSLEDTVAVPNYDPSVTPTFVGSSDGSQVAMIQGGALQVVNLVQQNTTLTIPADSGAIVDVAFTSDGSGIYALTNTHLTQYALDTQSVLFTHAESGFTHVVTGTAGDGPLLVDPSKNAVLVDSHGKSLKTFPIHANTALFGNDLHLVLQAYNEIQIWYATNQCLRCVE